MEDMMVELRFVLAKTETVNNGTERFPKLIKLKRYTVFRGCQMLGLVEQRMTTFEKKRPNAGYVDRRWQSPRWYCRLPGEYPTPRQCYFETRAAAAASLVLKADPSPYMG